MINSVAVCGAVQDPEAFRPERWINEEGGEASVTEGLWQFGEGGGFVWVTRLRRWVVCYGGEVGCGV